jgi:hypothetical protein
VLVVPGGRPVPPPAVPVPAATPKKHR